MPVLGWLYGMLSVGVVFFSSCDMDMWDGRGLKCYCKLPL